MTAAITVPSPFGPLTIREEDGAIVSVDWSDGAAGDPGPLLEEAARQLAAYFAGSLRTFDLPMHPAGTDYQRRVWERMCRIPYGRTATYGDFADEIGGTARSVGTACGRNPIPILIPCHRVVAAGGRLGGYSGGEGLATKRFLLGLEAGPLAMTAPEPVAILSR